MVRMLAAEAADLDLDAGVVRPAARAGRPRRRRRRRLRDRGRGRRRRLDPARSRGHPGERHPGARASTSATSGSSPRPSPTTSRRPSTRSSTRTWTPEDRLALDVRAYRDGELVTQTFALNEASVEKAARERMIEVVVEIDGRPLSRWGCDGVVLSTPTGSTAYNFSAGGPIVWPSVEALLVVPISAHALFARPMVVAPDSVVAVEVIARTDGAGRAVVRRPAGRGPPARRPDRDPARPATGHPGAAAPRAVHRPAGRQVRPAGRGLARLGGAPTTGRGRRRDAAGDGRA